MLTALVLICVSAAAETPRIPIMAWLGVPSEQTSLARYEEMADCGITLAFQPFPNLDAALEALDVAQQVGVELYASCPELKSDTVATVERLKGHPALAGYALRDEPGAALFPELAEWVHAIYAVDDTRWCYINLFPTYASPEQLGTDSYREHVRLFLDTVPQKVLSFDHYPVLETADGMVIRPDYYENLRIIREEAQRKGIPFWAFALSLAHAPYPLPEEAHMRLQQFSNLLHGAQGLQYFTYWTPEPTEQWNFHDAPIERDGTRTVVYDRVKAVNELLQHYAAVFVGAVVEQVGHLGEPIPEGAERFEIVAPLTGIESNGAPILVSRLRNGDRTYLCVLNVSLEEAVEVVVHLEKGFARERVMPGRAPDTVSGPFTLAPASLAVVLTSPR